jgi:hypothetical protein
MYLPYFFCTISSRNFPPYFAIRVSMSCSFSGLNFRYRAVTSARCLAASLSATGAGAEAGAEAGAGVRVLAGGSPGGARTQAAVRHHRKKIQTKGMTCHQDDAKVISL